MRTHQSLIWSIFGQIEACVAEAMIEEGKLTRIRQADIPPSALYNDAGVRAVFAVVISAKDVPEFERRVAELRA